MNAQTETFEEEYEEYDEFDDDDEDGERGLSGLVVLLMGIVMLGAFASVVWIAYQQGVKNGGGESAKGNAPYVAAEPGPVKIENKDAANAKTDEPAVYDKFDGEEAQPVETMAAKPEEPVDRTSEDPIASIATNNGGSSSSVVDDAVADRIASLAAADDAKTDEPGMLSQQQAASEKKTPPAKTAKSNPAPTKPEPAKMETEKPATASPSSSASSSSGDALSGTHVVQVAAFGSEAEADQSWARLQKKLGDYLGGKSEDIERADLGSKGIYYRLRIGPFSSADDAKTYCAGLKSRGQDCLVKAK